MGLLSDLIFSGQPADGGVEVLIMQVGERSESFFVQLAVGVQGMPDGPGMRAVIRDEDGHLSLRPYERERG